MSNYVFKSEDWQIQDAIDSLSSMIKHWSELASGNNVDLLKCNLGLCGNGLNYLISVDKYHLFSTWQHVDKSGTDMYPVGGWKAYREEQVDGTLYKNARRLDLAIHCLNSLNNEWSSRHPASLQAIKWDYGLDLSLKGWDLVALLAAIAFMFTAWYGATHFVHI